jgi:hypothetical protein
MELLDACDEMKHDLKVSYEGRMEEIRFRLEDKNDTIDFLMSERNILLRRNCVLMELPPEQCQP